MLAYLIGIVNAIELMDKKVTQSMKKTIPVRPTVREDNSVDVAAYLRKIILEHFNDFTSNLWVDSGKSTDSNAMVVTADGGKHEFAVTVTRIK